METMSVGDFKTHFSEVLKKVMAGKEIGIAYGKKKEIVAKLVPRTQSQQKRKIGILEGKARVTFARNAKLSEAEFIGL
ncbi:prevent-host-death protein [Niabella ginsenosidivorans]|uniref:Prevent-host-death protein n=1 Tax=Niabella ginsenosidivorans TaxID=1176587 RepID=A0A1A9I0B1_9BACT|nr:prevent-host-death protein [Niabella ginsenosidivorans]ANH80122.1 prevent-host-death protein [Niabella ginsenosidivorans]